MEKKKRRFEILSPFAFFNIRVRVIIITEFVKEATSKE